MSPTDETRQIQREDTSAPDGAGQGSRPRPDRSGSTSPTAGESAPAEPSWADRLRARLDAILVVGGAIGVVLLVIGLVTLARTGIPTETITAPETVVGAFGRTPLMGIIEIVIGLLFVGAGASRHGNNLTALGFIIGVFGIVWLIEPGAFQSALGIDRATAWLYLIAGAASVATGALSSPSTTERTVVRS